MKLLSWNVWGLRGSRMFRDIRDFISVHKSDLVFLIKTIMMEMQMGKLKLRLCMGGVLCVGRNEDGGGFAGGLCLLWRDNIFVSFYNSSFSFINVGVTLSNNKSLFWTGFHGEADANRHRFSREALKNLVGASTNPWLCVGDFNEIHAQEEKQGGNPRSQRAMVFFYEIVVEADLFKFMYSGHFFTWSNKRDGEANI